MITLDERLAEKLLNRLQAANVNMDIADQTLTEYLAVIRAQAATIDELKLIADAQDAIITKLKKGAMK